MTLVFFSMFQSKKDFKPLCNLENSNHAKKRWWIFLKSTTLFWSKIVLSHWQTYSWLTPTILKCFFFQNSNIFSEKRKNSNCNWLCMYFFCNFLFFLQFQSPNWSFFPFIQNSLGFLRVVCLFWRKIKKACNSKY